MQNYFIFSSVYLHLFQNYFPHKLDTHTQSLYGSGRFPNCLKLLKKPEIMVWECLTLYIAAGFQTCNQP